MASAVIQSLSTPPAPEEVSHQLRLHRRATRIRRFSLEDLRRQALFQQLRGSTLHNLKPFPETDISKPPRACIWRCFLDDCLQFRQQDLQLSDGSRKLDGAGAQGPGLHASTGDLGGKHRSVELQEEGHYVHVGFGGQECRDILRLVDFLAGLSERVGSGGI